jgi:hypothetical protein
MNDPIIPVKAGTVGRLRPLRVPAIDPVTAWSLLTA